MSFIKLFILTILMTFVPFSTVASAGYVAEYLAQAQFTTRVNKRVPVDNIKTLSSDFRKVYFFTDIRDCEDCDVEHQWWYRGKKVSVVEGETTGNRYRWWTSKTLTRDMLGDWTVKVIVDDDEVYTKTLTYYKPTKVQQQNAPLQRRVQVQEAGECELQLRHFSGEMKKNPDDPYIKFMLDKWGKRCSGK